MTVATITVTCRDCGTEWDTEPAMFRGRNMVPTRGLCANCEQAEQATEAKAARQDRWLSYRAASGLPKAHWDRPLPSETTDAGRLLRAWAKGELQLLTLTGPVGVGKTWAAAATIWRAWWWRPVRWIEVARTMTQLRAAFGDDDRAKALGALTGHGSAVFDDLDKVPGTEAGLGALFSALDGRLSAGVPVLVTMNTSIGQLATQIDRSKGGELGAAVASRLSAGELIQVGGEDKRRRAA